MDPRDDVKTIKVERCPKCHWVTGYTDLRAAPAAGHRAECEDAGIDDVRRGLVIANHLLSKANVRNAGHVMERVRWEGKFRIVCHENNRLRAEERDRG